MAPFSACAKSGGTRGDVEVQSASSGGGYDVSAIDLLGLSSLRFGLQMHPVRWIARQFD